jgi:hypothetical protein
MLLGRDDGRWMCGGICSVPVPGSREEDGLEMTEVEFQRPCIQYLRDKGWLILRINSGRSSSGVPFVRWYCAEKDDAQSEGCADLIALSPSGVFCAFELKQDGNRATDAQEFFLESVRLRGGMGDVVRSLDDLAELIRDI